MDVLTASRTVHFTGVQLTPHLNAWQVCMTLQVFTMVCELVASSQQQVGVQAALGAFLLSLVVTECHIYGRV
jgi:hypothetical protein